MEWHPWGEEALTRARREQKPILLSVGYSACHWCHVMAHESFEDEASAAVMNEHFVNIKVDREERPDLDKIYQLAHQMLTRNSGGWPLTMFLDPDTLVPFFGGTYFPKSARYQLPGFVEVLLRVAAVFAEKRDELTDQGLKVLDVFAKLNPETGAGELSDQALLDAARQALAAQYDSAWGGFGNAPKFPMPHTVDRLLRHAAHAARMGERDREAMEMAMTTLTKIARGGIYDHVGGGFCRYATDRKWMIPHFEKMLYDNGSLLALYANALAIGPDALFEGAVRETAAWLIREMRHPGGAFYAALDADSEGEEGKYYLWRRDQVKRLLDPDEYLLVETLYGLDKPANFEGKWNFHRFDAFPSVVERLSMTPETGSTLLASARAKLFREREKRTRPGLDDKILTAWNALAIKGLARAGSVLGEDEWIRAATDTVDFIRAELNVDGTLRATCKDGEARHGPYLDDYATLIAALLVLLQARWRDADLELAVALADGALDRFEDREHGGFFFTGRDHETLIHRPKPTMDDASPPGNGVLAEALIRLGHLLGETRYLEAAERALKWARGQMEQYPAGHCTLLAALELTVHPHQQVLLRGPDDLLAPFLSAARSSYAPWRDVYAIPFDAESIPPYLPRLLSAQARGHVAAYVCTGLSCSAPISDLDALKQALI